MGSIVNSIMSFNIIESKIELSKSDVIIAKYNFVKNRIEENHGDINTQENLKLLREKFIYELKELEIEDNEIEKWIEPLS